MRTQPTGYDRILARLRALRCAELRRVFADELTEEDRAIALGAVHWLAVAVDIVQRESGWERLAHDVLAPGERVIDGELVYSAAFL